MNPNIQHLVDIAKKPKKLIIGLMSGTSLDGLDIALCKVEGSGMGTKLELLHFKTVQYTSDFKKEIQTFFAKKTVDLQNLCLLNPRIALQHAAAVNCCLKEWKVDAADVDLLASHGQTLYHAPKSLHRKNEYGNATLQMGDGDHLSVATGIITVSDFRQKHIAAGGEGAPLAGYGDVILFGKKGEDRLLLNIGGIANFTFLPGSPDSGVIICTDVGPGNTMMDAFVQQKFPGKYYDEDSNIAKSGVINEALLASLKEDSFFEMGLPKTTGPELFNLNFLSNAKQKINRVEFSEADIMATLNKFSADMIVSAIRKCKMNVSGIKIFCSGGGIHNPLLMSHLKAQLPECTFHNTKDAGIDPDAKEAVLFALLANECICGNSFGFGKEFPSVSMGKISFPT